MIINNPELVYRNFQGRGSKFNEPGMRNFCVILDEELEKEAIDLGCRVRTAVGAGEGNPTLFKYIPVHVPEGFAFEDPAMPKMLDDHALSPSRISLAGMPWEAAGRSGVKMYLVHIDFDHTND